MTRRFMLRMQRELNSSCVEQIGDFCNPTPVRNFHWVIRSDPNPVGHVEIFDPIRLLSEKLSDYWSDQCSLDIHIGSGWLFSKSSPTRPGSEFQNPVGLRSGNRIMFNTGVFLDKLWYVFDFLFREGAVVTKQHPPLLSCSCYFSITLIRR